MKKHVDALGNEIVVGQTYGYSSPSSGRHRVVVGKVLGCSETKVRLEVLNVKEFMYGESMKPYAPHAPALSIAGYLLFPVVR